MKNALSRHLVIAALSLCPAASLAQSAHRQMREGDRHYDKKSWSAAEEAYRKATPSASAWHNAGNAAYQQGKYEVAAESFKKAAAAATPEARSAAFFNLGNAYLQQGKYAEAIAAYEKSLRQQPNRFDAKKNLQIAKKKLKEQEEPPPPPPPQKTPPPPPPPKPQRNYLDQAQQPLKKEEPSAGLSPDAAKHILQTLVVPDEEKSARDYRTLAPSTKPSRVKKDW
ncbi:MAG: tetratricopeptide repeat protein [Saprospiraceae bacterium]|nr:tetratricopeptide repeat protein [Saprospiraceae bacterium]